MTLIGIIDPSWKASDADDYASNPYWYTPEELLDHAATCNPKWSAWPYELIRVILDNHQERDYISTTMVAGGCPRSSVLERKVDYIESLDRYYAATRGTMVHAILERAARDNSLAEARFYTDIGGVPFSCSPDLIDYVSGDMYDYKLTENPPMWDMWPNHMRQLQFNRFVVNNATLWTQDGEGFDIPFNPRTLKFNRLAIVYLGPKGPKTVVAEKKIPYRRKDGEWAKNKRPVPRVDTDEEVLEDLRPRVEAMTTALDSFPKWPRGLEKYWKGPAGWTCPGKPWCFLPDCLAKRYPNGLKWERT